VRGRRPGVTLQQDGTDYFDLHHTPDDTLDKIDPEKLRQNVAAYTAMIASSPTPSAFAHTQSAASGECPCSTHCTLWTF
jgi:aminopeptidase-like protein